MSYSVIKIEGSGDYASYTKLADDLIRRSKLYRHLCKKIWRAKTSAGSQKYHRLKTKEKLLQAEKEFNTAEREYISAIRKLNREVDKLNRRLEDRRERIKHLDNLIKHKDKFYDRAIAQYRKVNANLKRDAFAYRKIKSFFVAPVSKVGTPFWNSNETWLRYIIAFEELKRDKKLNNVDYYIMMSSLYFSTITANRISKRLGMSISPILASIKRLVDQEYLYKSEKIGEYTATEKGVKIAKQITYAVRGKQRVTYFEEEPRPRKVIEQ